MVTITLRPMIAVVAGSKLVITISGDLILLLPQIVTTVISPTAAINTVSSRLVNSREIQVTFGTDIPAQTIITVALASFRLPSSSLSGSDSLEAAIVDTNGVVLAPSSSGSYPAIFSSTVSGSSVSISSSVANSSAVTVAVM
jgi:hypothetical protein